MPRSKRKHTTQSTSLSILSPDYAKFQFNELLEFLNTGISRIPNPDPNAGSIWKTVDRSDVQIRLKSFIEQLMEDGQNLNKLFRRNPLLAQNCTHGRCLCQTAMASLSWRGFRF